MALLLLVKLGLRLLPFQTLQRFLARAMLAPVGLRNSDPAFPDRIAWAVAVASRCLPGTRICLPQALTGQVLLRREGYPAHLTLGVARIEEGRLEAHAWVESRGKVVIGGGGLERYNALSTLEGERP